MHDTMKRVGGALPSLIAHKVKQGRLKEKHLALRASLIIYKCTTCNTRPTNNETVSNNSLDLYSVLHTWILF